MAYKQSNFYKNSADYWSNVPATIDGVLGGFGHISDADIKGSRDFLDEIFNLGKATARTRALDCGAGIGRISSLLLMPVFEKVDLVEQDKKFVNTARELFGEESSKVGVFYNTGLQNFTPHNHYDLIWCQWVLGYLKDYDLIDFLIRCKKVLNTNGVIIIKENITRQPEIEFDEEDSSVTRPYALMEAIFKEAKLTLLKESEQHNFPDDLYPVHMFALIPSAEGSCN